MTFCQIPSTYVDPLKNITASERGIFPYMTIVKTSNISESVQGISMEFYRDVLLVTIRFLRLMLIGRLAPV